MTRSSSSSLAISMRPLTASSHATAAVDRDCGSGSPARRRRAARAASCRVLGPPAAVVARLLAARHLLGAQRVELVRRHVAAIRESAARASARSPRDSDPSAASGSTGLRRSRGRATPSQSRIACTASGVERSTSVSSMRRMNVPRCLRANAHGRARCGCCRDAGSRSDSARSACGLGASARHALPRPRAPGLSRAASADRASSASPDSAAPRRRSSGPACGRAARSARRGAPRPRWR